MEGGQLKNAKKNNKALIGLIQSASYLLLCVDHAHLPKNSAQKKSWKNEINQLISAMKHDIRKLKRV